MKTRILVCGAALAALLLAGVRPASAQEWNWCYDWCYSYTSCDDQCWNGGWTTCGEWGTCDFHYCSWSSICNANVLCTDECYDGEWPYGSWTTCGDAGKECKSCEPDYEWTEEPVGAWNVVYYPWYPPNTTPVCEGYGTLQWIGTDVSYPPCGQTLYGDCRVVQLVGPIVNDPYCCDDMGGCWGEVWPSSCTN